MTIRKFVQTLNAVFSGITFEKINRSPEVIGRRPCYFFTIILRYISKFLCMDTMINQLVHLPGDILSGKIELMKKYVSKNPRNIHKWSCTENYNSSCSN